ncbi:MAG: WGxxGxxG-CTERM domain-containing protein [Microcoleus anatoxicus]|uniref:WGxxGxxG family protein n=1 Tax=Microcoleus anatoxicus TaxID=2705319 RepID=UPI0036735F90
MKRSDLSKVISAGIIAAGLAIVPANLPAAAQTNTAPGTNSTTTTTSPRSDVYRTESDRDFDWGWLGLLGLSGLFGLMPRKETKTVNYTTTDRDPSVRTEY